MKLRKRELGNCNMVGAADGVQNLKSHILLAFPSLQTILMRCIVPEE